MSTTYLLEHALIGDRVERDVLVGVIDGRFISPLKRGNVHFPAEISAGEFPFHRVTGESSEAAAGAVRVHGLTLPGFANCHSHAFHRALRGRTHGSRGSFWTWREQMYAVAHRLTPELYHELAFAAYTEMRCAGFTSVGEFHYLHHGPDGTPYDDPNAMGEALIEAARRAGIRITLLDTCYLAAGIDPDGSPRPPEGVQVRFSDGDAMRWAERFTDLATRHADTEGVVIGAAIHSVRSVPADQLATVVEAAAGRPLHVHLSEQPAENEQCLAAHGRTPTELLHQHGALGPETTAVHATHLTDHDIRLLGETRTHACLCPTTERDLADGIGPSRALHAAGARLTLGSDSHAVIDPFEEMRAVELHERLVTGTRGNWQAAELLEAATGTGHASLGFPDAGRIAPGHRADLIVLDLFSARTGGTGASPETAVFTATTADVTQVIVDGVKTEIEMSSDDVGFWMQAMAEDLELDR